MFEYSALIVFFRLGSSGWALGAFCLKEVFDFFFLYPGCLISISCRPVVLRELRVNDDWLMPDFHSVDFSCVVNWACDHPEQCCSSKSSSRKIVLMSWTG